MNQQLLPRHQGNPSVPIDAVADGDCAEHLGWHQRCEFQPPPVEPARLAHVARGDGAVAIRYPNDRFSEILVTKTTARSIARLGDRCTP